MQDLWSSHWEKLSKCSHDRENENEGNEDLDMFCSVEDWYWTALNYIACRWADKSQFYNEQGPNHDLECASRLKIRSHAPQFYPMNLIPVLGILSGFKRARHCKEIYEGAPMWVIPHFIKQMAVAALPARLWMKPQSSKPKTRNAYSRHTVRLWITSWRCVWPKMWLPKRATT